VCIVTVLEGCGQEDFDPRKRLDSLMHLTELCIEVIQQNEEYHAEVCHCAPDFMGAMGPKTCGVKAPTADVRFSKIFGTVE